MRQNAKSVATSQRTPSGACSKLSAIFCMQARSDIVGMVAAERRATLVPMGVPRSAARLLKRLRAKRIHHTHRYYLVFQTPPVPLQPIAPPSRPETSCGDAINGCLTKRYTRTTTRANVPLSFHTSSMLCLHWSDEQFIRHLTHMICSQRLAVMNASIACTTSRGTSRCCWSIPSLNAFEPHSAACADVQCCD